MAAVFERAWYVGGRSIPRVLHVLFWDRFWVASALLLVGTLANAAMPYMMGEILRFVEGADNAVTSWFVGHGLARGTAGLLLAGAMTALTIVRTGTYHQFWYQATRVGVHAQACLMSMVFRKGLALSNAARTRYSVGELSNLMSSDACRVSDTFLACMLPWGTWAALLTVGITLACLYSLLGSASLVGVGVMVSYIGTTAIVSRAMGRYSKAWMALRDVRAKRFNELLTAIRLVKVLGVEPWALATVDAARVAELVPLRRMQLLNGVFVVIGASGALIVSACSFAAAYYWTGIALTPAVAFTSVSWFQMLQWPLQMLSSTVFSIVQNMISFRCARGRCCHGESDSRCELQATSGVLCRVRGCGCR